MSTVTEGILAMPYEMAMADPLSRHQFYGAVQALRARCAELEKDADKWRAVMATLSKKEAQAMEVCAQVLLLPDGAQGEGS